MSRQLPFMKPSFEKRVKEDYSRGIDCGHKSPFKITLEIPRGKKELEKSQKTRFYALQQIPGAKVGLKYYPDEKGYAYICVRIEDDMKREHFGVACLAEVSRHQGISFCDFKKKNSPLDKHFHFGGRIQSSKEFIKDELNLLKGVEITVEGYVFIWDEKLRARENWRFSAGILGYRTSWDLLDGYGYTGNIDFTCRDGTTLSADLCILRKQSSFFERIWQNPTTSHKIYFPISYESLHRAIALCYDYRIFKNDPIPYVMKLELLVFFAEFDVSSYKWQLENHLVEYVDYANVGRLAKYARHAKSELLQKKCLEFMRMCIRTGKFFLVHDYEENSKILADAIELETYHEWLSG